jgi:hypothetical protein
MGDLPNQDPAALDQLIDRTLARIGVPLQELDRSASSQAINSASASSMFGGGSQWRRQAAAAQAFIDEQRQELPGNAVATADSRSLSSPVARVSLAPAAQQQSSKAKPRPNQSKSASKANQRKAKSPQKPKSTRA